MFKRFCTWLMAVWGSCASPRSPAARNVGCSQVEAEPFAKLLAENWFACPESLVECRPEELTVLGIPFRVAQQIIVLAGTPELQAPPNSKVGGCLERPLGAEMPPLPMVAPRMPVGGCLEWPLRAEMPSLPMVAPRRIVIGCLEWPLRAETPPRPPRRGANPRIVGGNRARPVKSTSSPTPIPSIIVAGYRTRPAKATPSPPPQSAHSPPPKALRSDEGVKRACSLKVKACEPKFQCRALILGTAGRNLHRIEGETGVEVELRGEVNEGMKLLFREAPDLRAMDCAAQMGKDLLTMVYNGYAHWHAKHRLGSDGQSESLRHGEGNGEGDRTTDGPPREGAIPCTSASACIGERAPMVLHLIEDQLTQAMRHGYHSCIVSYASFLGRALSFLNIPAGVIGAVVRSFGGKQDCGLPVPPLAVWLLLRVAGDMHRGAGALTIILRYCGRYDGFRLGRLIGQWARDTNIQMTVDAFDALLRLHSVQSNVRALHLHGGMLRAHGPLDEDFYVDLLTRCAEAKFFFVAEELIGAPVVGGAGWGGAAVPAREAPAGRAGPRPLPLVENRRVPALTSGAACAGTAGPSTGDRSPAEDDGGGWLATGRDGRGRGSKPAGQPPGGKRARGPDWEQDYTVR